MFASGWFQYLVHNVSFSPRKTSQTLEYKDNIDLELKHYEGREKISSVRPSMFCIIIAWNKSSKGLFWKDILQHHCNYVMPLVELDIKSSDILICTSLTE